MMRYNVCSKIERSFRVIIGVALLSLLYFLETPVSYVGLPGLVPIATAIFGYCPINHLLEIDTCKMKKVHA